MPLVRYELRCEHSLANPELFRAAARDDPEGLLEGLAMAGLVGIVRQLGDLAEFAAEVFRDLHEEFVAVGGRAHDITVRVQQLEAELPAVEKALLSEPNQLRFAYTNGADWHASIRSDQNHCTSGELPRFVRNFYQECRGPPRLFLLDRFDVAGAGACLKRYSDPSFFKLEWASTELMKAQRAQRDKKARRDKKKGRRRKTGAPIAAINQIPARVRYGSASLDDLDSLSYLLVPTLKNEVSLSSSDQVAKNGRGTQTERRSNLGPQNKGNGGPLPPIDVSPAGAEGGAASESVKISVKAIENNASGKFYEPIETENDAESMAGRISKIIEMEEHDAMPLVGLVPRNVENKRSKGADELKLSDFEGEGEGDRVAGEGVESSLMGRSMSSPVGKANENLSTAGREGSNFGNGKVSEHSVGDAPSCGIGIGVVSVEGNSSDLRTLSSSVPDRAGSQQSLSKSRSMDGRAVGQPSGRVSPSGKVSRRNFVDAKEAHVIAARFPKQNPERSSTGLKELGSASGRNLLQSLAILRSVNLRSDGVHGLDEQQPKHIIIEASAGKGSGPATADETAGSLLSVSGGNPGVDDSHLSKPEGLAINMVGSSDASRSLRETVHNSPGLARVRSEEIHPDEEELGMASSVCSSPGQADVRPTVSVLSRLSYSSELMPVSSGSEPDSPVSPHSPPFNALYTPPGSPSRFLGGMAESPTGLLVGSHSRSGDGSVYGSSRSEIPILCLSPRSQLALSSQRDCAAPLRPPPPLPIVIHIPEIPSQLYSRQELTSVETEAGNFRSRLLDPPANSDADGAASESNGDRHYAEEHAESAHAEPAGGSRGIPDLVGHFESPLLTEQTETPGADLEADVGSPRIASTPGVGEPLRPSLGSSLDYSGVGATQISSGNLDLTESRNVDGLTSDFDDSLVTAVGRVEGYPVPEVRQGCVRSGAPIQDTPMSSGQVISTVHSTVGISGEEYESGSSSPTGSVIIKDTPSPRGSPSSNYYSGSEPEIHEYHPSLGPVSPRSVSSALEDVVNHRESSGGDFNIHENLIFESSESGPTPTIQETGFVSSGSAPRVGAALSVPEDRVEASASISSNGLQNLPEDISLQGPLRSHEAITVGPISVTTADMKSQKSSASNSPVVTPPRMDSLSTGDEVNSTLQWAGRSRPESPLNTETRGPSGRSASKSPRTSPPKFVDHASSLRWRGRSDPASLQPDFSLPPNLVCRSETSSPPCSPPPSSDLESPKQWDESSEDSSSSESLEQSDEEVANVEVYRFPESPLPPDSPTMSEVGDHFSERASDIEDGGGVHEEQDIADPATEGADSQISSVKLSTDALSTGLEVPHDDHPSSEPELKPSTVESSTEFVSLESQVHSRQQSNINESHDALPLPVSGSTVTTQDALAAAIAHHDWNMMKAMSFQDSDHKQQSPSGRRSLSHEEVERKDHVVRPAANINVAAILEKAKHIRQAFVGSDDEGDEEDDWSDS